MIREEPCINLAPRRVPLQSSLVETPLTGSRIAPQNTSVEAYSSSKETLVSMTLLEAEVASHAIPQKSMKRTLLTMNVGLLSCSKGGSHAPKSKARRLLPQYQLFQAALDGCLLCVRRLIEEEPKVDTNILSETNLWSVADMANYSVEHGVDGASAVKAYLDAFWPGIPRKANM